MGDKDVEPAGVQGVTKRGGDVPLGKAERDLKTDPLTRENVKRQERKGSRPNEIN